MTDDHDSALLAEFLEEVCDARSPLPSDTDLFGTFGIEGDDADEFMGKFAERFEVDLSNYAWYFHHRDETFFNPGALLFKRPDQFVQRIPITPNILLEAIRTKHWPVQYPEHKLPIARWDIVFAIPVSLVLMIAGATIVSAIEVALR